MNFSMHGPGIFAGLWDPERVQNYLHNNAKMLIEAFSALAFYTDDAKAVMGKISGVIA